MGPQPPTGLALFPFAQREKGKREREKGRTRGGKSRRNDAQRLKQRTAPKPTAPARTGRGVDPKGPNGVGPKVLPRLGLTRSGAGENRQGFQAGKALPRQDSAPRGIELHRLRELTREPPRAKTDRRRRHKPRVKVAA